MFDSTIDVVGCCFITEQIAGAAKAPRRLSRRWGRPGRPPPSAAPRIIIMIIIMIIIVIIMMIIVIIIMIIVILAHSNDR